MNNDAIGLTQPGAKFPGKPDSNRYGSPQPYSTASATP